MLSTCASLLISVSAPMHVSRPIRADLAAVTECSLSQQPNLLACTEQSRESFAQDHPAAVALIWSKRWCVCYCASAQDTSRMIRRVPYPSMLKIACTRGFESELPQQAPIYIAAGVREGGGVGVGRRRRQPQQVRVRRERERPSLQHVSADLRARHHGLNCAQKQAGCNRWTGCTALLLLFTYCSYHRKAADVHQALQGPARACSELRTFANGAGKRGLLGDNH